MTKTTLRWGLSVLVLLAAVLAAAYGVRSWSHLRRESAEQGTALRNHLERIVVVSEALDLLDAGRPDEARALLQGQLERSFERADTIIALGGAPWDPQLRFRAPVERARAHATRPETRAQAERVLAALP
jgi:hypothetical protein